MTFCHMMPLTLASHDKNGSINDNIAFLRLNKVKHVFQIIWKHWHQHYITWCWQHSQWNHYIPYVQTIKMSCCMMFWSCDAIEPVSVLNDANGIVKGVTVFLGSRYQNEVQHDIFRHVTPLVLALASSDADDVINGIIAFLRSKWGTTLLFGHVMLWYCMPMAHDIGTSTSTSTGTKCHIIHLNFYPNKRNAKLSLMDHQHNVTWNMSLQCKCKIILCSSNVTHKPHV